MLIINDPIVITTDEIMVAIACHTANNMTYRLKDLNKVWNIDKKLYPTATSMRFTLDFGAEETRRFRQYHEKYKDQDSAAVLKMAFDIMKDTMQTFDEFKGARRKKYHNLLEHGDNVLRCFFHLSLLLSYKAFYTFSGDTGSLTMNKKLELIDITKNKIQSLARSMRNGLISEDEFFRIYFETVDIMNTEAPITMTKTEMMEIGREQGLLAKITPDRIDGILGFMSESLQLEISGQPRLLETDYKKFEMFALELLKED